MATVNLLRNNPPASYQKASPLPSSINIFVPGDPEEKFPLLGISMTLKTGRLTIEDRSRLDDSQARYE